ncbi:hypothetical protein TNCV_608761 [Trichonephila clavipes]|nr:hypothetical protein TNCV_608761 [Trichonephila clavipes]
MLEQSPREQIDSLIAVITSSLSPSKRDDSSPLKDLECSHHAMQRLWNARRNHRYLQKRTLDALASFDQRVVKEPTRLIQKFGKENFCSKFRTKSEEAMFL